MPEVVPRQSLVQAIALDRIGFNLARALGAALGGVLVLFGGPALAFSLYAVSFLAGIAALLGWRRTPQPTGLPRERLLSAMRAGMRFTRHNPAMQAAVLCAVAFFLPCAAPWALLPLVVRAQLGLGAGSFGVLLGSMLPQSHGRVLETMRYRVAPTKRSSWTPCCMLQHARGRAGALDWRPYEDIAHPESWLEAWPVES